MTKYFATFLQSDVMRRNKYVLIPDADTNEAARERMFAKYGDKWGFTYLVDGVTTGLLAQKAAFGITEIPFGD